MFETENLRRSYGDRAALQGLTLRVAPNEILGFLGPNGAGKSTTVKILTGMIKPDGGRATVAGFDVVGAPLEVKQRLREVRQAAIGVAPIVPPPAGRAPHREYPRVST